MGSPRATRAVIITVGVLEVLALGVWVGGLIVTIGAVIPAVFNVGIDMETGGRLVTRLFDGYNRLVAAMIGVLVVAAGVRGYLSRRVAGSQVAVGRAEIGVLGVMIVLYGVITLWLGPEAHALQQAAFAAEGVEAKKAAYAAFFDVHRVLRTFYVLNLGLGIGLVALKVRQWIWNPS